MEIAEKEGGLPVFNIDILDTFFLLTAKIIARPTGKVGTNLSPRRGKYNIINIYIFWLQETLI